MTLSTLHIDQACSHCGDACDEHVIIQNDNHFCCNGCKMVYTILHENGMSDYYRFDENPGVSQRKTLNKTFDYLDNSEIKKALLEFQEGGTSKVSFLLPQIHCSACLWLLENISKFDTGIIKSSVNFQSKRVRITFKEEEISLRQVVELLAKIGYEPAINYDQLDKKAPKQKFDRILIYKLGLSGFAFGNIMLLSFPEYLGFDKASYLFRIGYINIILALPVLLYSGVDYIKSAYNGLKLREFNIDLPIALGMLALFSRSVYDILSHSGEGYLDSFAGFVFFLLIGRWFQSYTYKALDFDRNYKSYFPISASVKLKDVWISKSIDLLQIKDRILIRNQELIPTDGILVKGKARLDYSFVTGESTLISKELGSEVFAGAKHAGDSIEIEVTKTVNQSYLTQLWNEDTFKTHKKSQSSKLIDLISKYFTVAVLVIATLTFIYWLQIDGSKAINTFTAVLIVACPCALALSIPFTYGNILRLLAGHGFFLRNVQTIEHIQDVDYIIFDKTGTITDSKKIEVSYSGNALDKDDRQIIKSVCMQSAHPLSKAIVSYLSSDSISDVTHFREVVGSGLIAECKDRKVKLGSSSFVFNTQKENHASGVFIEIDGKYIGHFEFKHAFRENIEGIIEGLSKKYKHAILSGDNDHEAQRINELVGTDCAVHFNQSPKDKLTAIKSLQEQGHNVLMVGDGLNDAGALKQANVGLVISDNENNFTPACDGIVEAQQFENLFKQLQFVRRAKYIIYGAFALAFTYNFVGLSYAIKGDLSPVIAAILMPLSSITVIIYGMLVSWFLYQKNIHD